MTKPFLIGIGGGTGSGKTTLTLGIAQEFSNLGVCILQQDAYYLDRSHLSEEERQSVNYDEPSAIDHEMLLSHLKGLLSGQSVRKPRYSFVSHTRVGEGESVDSRPVIVLEGLFALWEPRIRSVLDLKVFLDADPDVRLIRRLRRDVEERGRTVESVITQYIQSVRPMYQRYIGPTKAHADLVVDTTDSSVEGSLLIYRTIRQRMSGACQNQ